MHNDRWAKVSTQLVSIACGGPPKPEKLDLDKHHEDWYKVVPVLERFGKSLCPKIYLFTKCSFLEKHSSYMVAPMPKSSSLSSYFFLNYNSKRTASRLM